MGSKTSRGKIQFLKKVPWCKKLSGFLGRYSQSCGKMTQEAIDNLNDRVNNIAEQIVINIYNRVMWITALLISNAH